MAASIVFWMTLRAASLEEICVFGNWFGRMVHSKEIFLPLDALLRKRTAKSMLAGFKTSDGRTATAGKVRGTKETCNRCAIQILARLKQFPQLYVPSPA
jgi:hypothetical protein